MFERDQRKYMGYTIGQSFFSRRWIIRRGRTHVASALSAFDAVELVDGIIDADIRERLLQGDMRAIDSLGERPGRYEAINGKNPSLASIAENIARAQLALERDLPGLAERRAKSG
jgi:hypothetical protein